MIKTVFFALAVSAAGLATDGPNPDRDNYFTLARALGLDPVDQAGADSGCDRSKPE